MHIFERNAISFDWFTSAETFRNKQFTTNYAPKKAVKNGHTVQLLLQVMQQAEGNNVKNKSLYYHLKCKSILFCKERKCLMYKYMQ